MRGDSYDFDPVPDDPGDHVGTVDVRRRHPSGIERLTWRAPWPPGTVVRSRLGRARRRAGRPPSHVGIRPDHRLRLCFPTGAPVAASSAPRRRSTPRTDPPPSRGTSWVPGAAHLPAPGMGRRTAHGRGARLPGGGDADGVMRCAAPRSAARPLPAGTRPVPAGPLPTPTVSSRAVSRPISPCASPRPNGCGRTGRLRGAGRRPAAVGSRA
jgi:hypothetical protein